MTDLTIHAILQFTIIIKLEIAPHVIRMEIPFGTLLFTFQILSWLLCLSRIEIIKKLLCKKIIVSVVVTRVEGCPNSRYLSCSFELLQQLDLSALSWYRPNRRKTASVSTAPLLPIFHAFWHDSPVIMASFVSCCVAIDLWKVGVRHSLFDLKGIRTYKLSTSLLLTNNNAPVFTL